MGWLGIGIVWYSWMRMVPTKNMQQKTLPQISGSESHSFGTKHPHSMTGWGPSELFTRCVGADNQKTIVLIRFFSIFGWGYKATHITIITGGPHPVGYSIKSWHIPNISKSPHGSCRSQDCPGNKVGSYTVQCRWAWICGSAWGYPWWGLHHQRKGDFSGNVHIYIYITINKSWT